MTDLAGSRILVLGATGGLGSRIARLLSDRGAVLALSARDTSELTSLATELDAAAVPGDLLSVGTATDVVRRATERLGGLDGVVVAAGVVAFGPFGELTDQAVGMLFGLNTAASMETIRAAAPHLVESAAAGRDPFALVITAVVSEQPTAGMAAYSASKAATSAFVTAASRELRRSKVRLVDARPPHTETGLADRPVAGTAPSLPQGLAPDVVAGRIVAAIEAGERDLPASAFQASA